MKQDREAKVSQLSQGVGFHRSLNGANFGHMLDTHASHQLEHNLFSIFVEVNFVNDGFHRFIVRNQVSGQHYSKKGIKKEAEPPSLSKAVYFLAEIVDQHPVDPENNIEKGVD